MLDYLSPGLAYLAIPLSAGGCAWAQFSSLRGKKRACIVGLAAACSLLVLFLALHVYHLLQIDFTPQTNAYGSIFFVLNWAIDVVALIGLGLASAALVRATREGEHWQTFLKLHLQMCAHYGYFAAVIAALTFAVLYLSPYAI